MFLKKKNKEYLVVVYKKDLTIDINKILFSGGNCSVKEYFYVLHDDTAESHYHIYMRFDKPVTKAFVEKLFYKTKCYVSVVNSYESELSLLHYFTEGFRLVFESNYSIKVDEIKRKN